MRIVKLAAALALVMLFAAGCKEKTPFYILGSRYECVSNFSGGSLTEVFSFGLGSVWYGMVIDGQDSVLADGTFDRDGTSVTVKWSDGSTQRVTLIYPSGSGAVDIQEIQPEGGGIYKRAR